MSLSSVVQPSLKSTWLVSFCVPKNHSKITHAPPPKRGISWECWGEGNILLPLAQELIQSARIFLGSPQKDYKDLQYYTSWHYKEWEQVVLSSSLCFCW